MNEEVVAVLEIGTSNICCLIGELRDDNSVSVIAIGKVFSEGIRKGEVVNRDLALESIRKALKKTEKNYRKNIHSVIVTFSGGDALSHFSEGCLNIADPIDNQPQEISELDIANIVNIAERHSLNEKRIRMHTLQQYFQIDDINNILDPNGLLCEKLKLKILTIHGKKSVVDNFHKLLSDVPIICTDAVYSGLASALAVTNSDMRKGGVLTIDLGGGTTDYVLHHDGLVKLCKSFTVGGDHVTSDIAAGLQIPFKNAENLKVKEGSALSNLLERDRNISLPSDTQGFPGKMIRAVTLNTIIESRIEEIFTFIKDDIEKFYPGISLNAGILLTGGGAFLNGTRDLAQKVFNLPCMLGKPIDTHGLPSSSESAKYASLIGVIRYSSNLNKKIQKSNLIQRLKKIFWDK